jgi:site-specific DNA recombinase
MSIAAVETLVEDHWGTRELSDILRAEIRRDVVAYLDVLLPQRDKQLRAAERQVSQLTDERDALLRAHYAGAVPLDQLRSEQDRISTALANANRELTDRQLTRDQLHNALDHALSLLDKSRTLYRKSRGPERRAMNQALFERLYVYDDQIVDARPTDLFDRLLDPNLKKLLDEELTTNNYSYSPREAVTSPGTSKSSNLRPSHEDTSSNFRTLVAGTGFEPATSGL